MPCPRPTRKASSSELAPVCSDKNVARSRGKQLGRQYAQRTDDLSLRLRRKTRIVEVRPDLLQMVQLEVDPSLADKRIGAVLSLSIALADGHHRKARGGHRTDSTRNV